MSAFHSPRYLLYFDFAEGLLGSHGGAKMTDKPHSRFLLLRGIIGPVEPKPETINTAELLV